MSPKTPTIPEEAASWVQGFDEDDPQQSEQFLHWVRKSPEHLKEFFIATMLSDGMDKMDPNRTIDLDALIAAAKCNVSPIGPHVEITAPAETPRRRRWVAALLATAASVAIAAMATGLWLYRSPALPDGTYATAIGEQRVITLDDGSILSLNTQSRVRVSYSATSRDVVLVEGQAAFKVMHETRPFWVYAGAARIRDIGTDFDVRYIDNTVVLAVTEGSVEVTSTPEDTTGAGPTASPSPAPSLLTAGQRTVIDRAGNIDPIVRVDTNDVNAWKLQRLTFLDTPLEEIAREFNRYNPKPKLRVEGDAAKAHRFNGNFPAHDFASLYQILESEGLSYEKRGNDVIIRSAADLPPP